MLSGAEFWQLELTSLKEWSKTQVSPESYKYFESELSSHRVKTNLDTLLSQVEQSLKLPEAKLNTEQSFLLSLLIKKLGKYGGELHCDVELSKKFLRAYNKWCKVLFEKAQNITTATNGHVGTLKVETNYIFGSQTREQMSELKKANALYEFIEIETRQRQEKLEESKKEKRPDLIFDLAELNRPKNAPQFVNIMGRPLIEDEEVDEPKKRIKQNELQRERNEQDIDTVSIGEAFVRNVIFAQKSKQDVVIIAKWMEILK